jgi:tRNA-binding protein
LYKPEELVGRQVIAVTNFPPLQVADFMSEVLVLGVVLEDGGVGQIGPDREVPPGSRIRLGCSLTDGKGGAGCI